MTEFVVCSTGDEKPSTPHKAVKSPDEFDSIVCHWDDKEQGTWGRASIDKYVSGIQAWFPWGGEEHDSNNIGSFQVLVKHGDHRYSWIKVDRVRDRPHKFKPLEINGYAPAVINRRLGKIKIDELQGWTSWDGVEVIHDEDEVKEAIVLCVRQKNLTDAPGKFKYAEHDHELPDDAIQSPDREGSYVCTWGEKEQGTFGRIRVEDGRMASWFPWGGEEHASCNIGTWEVLCKDDDYKYKWKSAHKILDRPHKYEVFKVNGYSPAIVDDLLGKINLDNQMAWNSWGGEEIFFEGDDFLNAKVLCYKEKEDD